MRQPEHFQHPAQLFVNSGLGFTHGSLDRVEDIYSSRDHGQAQVQLSVNMATGNLLVRDHVFHYALVGFDFTFSMVYNSMAGLENRWSLAITRKLNTAGDDFLNLIYEDRHVLILKKSTYSQYIFEAITPSGKIIVEKNATNGWFKLYNYATGMTEHYTDKGLLRTRINHKGQTLTFSYNVSGQCIRVEDMSGNGLYINPEGFVESQKLYVSWFDKTNPVDYHPIVDYDFGANNQLVQTIIHNTPSSAYGIYMDYKDLGHDVVLESIQQSDKTTLNFTYSGNSVATIKAGDYDPYQFHYEASSSTCTDPFGQVTEVGFDSLSCLTLVKKPSVTGPVATTYTYHPGTPLLATRRRPNGATTTYSYDALSLLQTVQSSLGRLTHTYHDQETGMLISRVTYADLAHTQAQVEYYVWQSEVTADSVKNRLRYVIKPSGIISERAYNSQQLQVVGRVFLAVRYDTSHLQPTVPVDYNTALAWVSAQNLQHTQLTSTDYNARGQVNHRRTFTQTDPGGGGIFTDNTPDEQWVWDIFNRWTTHKVRQQGSVYSITTRSFDGLGRVLVNTSPTGAITRHEYHDSSRIISTSLPNGRVEHQTFDAAGLVAQHVATDGHIQRVTNFDRDKAGRLFQTILPDDSRLTAYYDPRGFLYCQIDEIGDAVQTFHDDLGHEVLHIAYETRIDIGTLKPGVYPSFTHSTSDRTTHNLFDNDGLPWWRVAADGGAIQFVFNGESLEILQKAYFNRAFVGPNYTILTELTVPESAKDRLSTKFYDIDSVLFATQNGDGFVTQHWLDNLKRSIKKVQYKKPTDVTTVFAAAKPTPTPGEDAVTDKSYDNVHALPLEVVEPEGAVTTHAVMAMGKASSLREYVTPVAAPTLSSFAPQTSEVLAEHMLSCAAAGKTAEGHHLTLRLTAKASADDQAASAAAISDSAVAGMEEGPEPSIGQHLVLRLRSADKLAEVASATDAVATDVAVPDAIPKRESTPTIPTATIATLPPESPEDYVENTHYDLLNRVASQVDSWGREYKQTFDIMGHKLTTQTTDARATESFRLNVYQYDLWEQLTAELGPRGGREYAKATTPAAREQIMRDYATWHAYTDKGLRASTTLPQNVGKTWFYYDNKKLLLFSVNRRGAIREFGYNAFERKPTEQIVYAHDLDASHIPSLTGGMITEPVADMLQAVRSDDDRITLTEFDFCGRVYGTRDGENYWHRLIFNPFGEPSQSSQMISETESVVTLFDYDHRGLRTDKTVDPKTAENPDGINIHESWGYDFLGLESQYTDPNSHTHLTAHYRNGLVHTKTNPLGDTTTLIWDARRRLLTEQDPMGAKTEHRYNQATREHTVTSAMARMTTHVSDVFKQEIEVANAYGRKRTGYDPAGAASYWDDSLNRARNKTRDYAGQVVTGLSWHPSTQPELGLKTDYHYGLAGGLTSSVVDPGGANLTTTQTTTTSEKMVTKVDPAGYLSEYERDKRGLVTLQKLDPKSASNPNGIDRVTKKSIDGRHKVTLVGRGDTANPYQFKKATGYDKPGRKISETIDPTISIAPGQEAKVVSAKTAGKQDQDQSQRPSAILAALDLARSAKGEPQSGASPSRKIFAGLNLTNHFERDASGNMLSKTDPSGHLTRYVYDKNNQKRYEISPMGSIKEYRYNKAGRRHALITYKNRVNPADFTNATTPAEAAGKITESNYDRYEFTIRDADGKPVYKANRNGVITESVFDKAGRQVAEIIYYKPVTTVNFNAASYTELAAAIVKTPGFDTYNYTVLDAAGQIVFKIDPTGAVIEQTYGVLPNKPMQKTAYAAKVDISQIQALSEITPAAVKALIKETPSEDRLTHYVYNHLQQLVYTIDAEHYVTDFEHDPNGLVKTTIRYATPISMPNPVTIASVKAAIKPVPGHDTKTTFTHNAAGKVVSKTNALNHSTTYQYNAVNLPVVRIDAKGHDWVKHYDAALRPDAELSPEFDVMITAYDPAKQEVTATPTKARQVKTTDYYPNGKVKSITTNPDTAETREIVFTYDADNHMETATVKNVPVDNPSVTPTSPTSPLPTHTVDVVKKYVFDAQGNRVAECDENGHWSFAAYDNLGQKVYEIDADNHVKYHEHNEKGQVIKTVAYADEIDFNPLDYIATGVTPTQVSGWVKPNAADDRELVKVYDLAGKTIEVTQSEVLVASTSVADNPAIEEQAPRQLFRRNAFGDVIEKRVLLDSRLQQWSTTVYKFDRLGRRLATVGPRRHLTFQILNHLNKPLFIHEYAKELPSLDYVSASLDELIHAATVSEDDRQTRHEYDAVGNNIITTLMKVLYQEIYQETGSDAFNFKNVTADVVTKRVFDALNHLISITNDENHTEFKYYNSLGKLIGVAKVPRTSYDFETAPKVLIPFILYGLNLDGARVTQTDFPTCKSADASGYVLESSPDERTIIKVLNNVGLLAAEKLRNGAIECSTYNPGRKVARKYRWSHNSTLVGQEVQELMQLFLTKFYYTPRMHLQRTERFRDQHCEFTHHKKYNAFSEVIAEGKDSDDLELQRDFSRAGVVLRTNQSRGAMVYKLPNAAGQQTLEVGSRKLDLSQTPATNLPSLLANAKADELVVTEMVRDDGGNITDRKLPAFTTTQAQQPDPLIFSPELGPLFSSPEPSDGQNVALYWPVESMTGVSIEASIWIKGQSDDRLFLGAPQQERYHGRMYNYYDFSNMTSDVYVIKIEYTYTDNFTGEPIKMPLMAGEMEINLITGKNEGSHHQVISQVDDHTIAIAGNTPQVYGAEVLQSGKSIAILGASQADGRYLIDLCDMVSGDYQIRLIYKGNQPSKPLAVNQTKGTEPTIIYKQAHIGSSGSSPEAYSLTWDDLPPGTESLSGRLIFSSEHHGVLEMDQNFSTEGGRHYFFEANSYNYQAGNSMIYGVSGAEKRYIGDAYNPKFNNALVPYIYIQHSTEQLNIQYVIVNDGSGSLKFLQAKKWFNGMYRADVSTITNPQSAEYQVATVELDTNIPVLPTTFRVHTRHVNKMVPKMIYFKEFWADRDHDTGWVLQQSLMPDTTLLIDVPDLAKSPWKLRHHTAGRNMDDSSYYTAWNTIYNYTKRLDFSLWLNGNEIKIFSGLTHCDEHWVTDAWVKPTQTLYLHPLPNTIKSVVCQYYDTQAQAWFDMENAQIVSNAVAFDVSDLAAGNYEFRLQALNSEGQIIDLSEYTDAYNNGWIVDHFSRNCDVGQPITTAVSNLQASYHPTDHQELDRWKNPTSKTDAMHNTTQYAYNRWNHVHTKTTPQVEVCDEHGDSQLHQLTTTTGYNRYGKAIGQRKPSGAAMVHDRDEASQVFRSFNAVGVVRNFCLDGFGQQTHVFNAEGNGDHQVFDHGGNITRVTDAEGNIQLYGYNAFDKRDQWTRYLTIGKVQTACVVRYGHDAMQHLILTVQPSGSWIGHMVDRKGNILVELRSDLWFMNYSRDWWGTILAHLDLGSGGSPGATYTFHYDHMQLLTRKTSTTGNHGFTPSGQHLPGMDIYYARNEAGAVQFLIDAASGLSTRFTHNAALVVIGEFFRNYDGLVYQATKMIVDALEQPITINDLRMTMHRLYDINRNIRALKSVVGNNAKASQEAWFLYYADDSMHIARGALVGTEIKIGEHGMMLEYDEITGLRCKQTKSKGTDAITYYKNGRVHTIQGTLIGWTSKNPLSKTQTRIYDNEVCTSIVLRDDAFQHLVKSDAYSYNKDHYVVKEVHDSQTPEGVVTVTSDYSDFDAQGLNGHEHITQTGGGAKPINVDLDAEYVAFDSKMIAKNVAKKNSSGIDYTTKATYLPAGQMHSVEGDLKESYRLFVTNSGFRIVQVTDGKGHYEYYFYLPGTNQPIFRYGNIPPSVGALQDGLNVSFLGAEPIGNGYPPLAPSQFTATERVHTFPAISQAVSGDESYAGRIARANGYSESTNVPVNQTVRIPAIVADDPHNWQGMYRPYNGLSIQGSLYPHIPYPKPHVSFWDEFIDVFIGALLAILIPEIAELIANPILAGLATVVMDMGRDALLQGVEMLEGLRPTGFNIDEMWKTGWNVFKSQFMGPVFNAFPQMLAGGVQVSDNILDQALFQLLIESLKVLDGQVKHPTWRTFVAAAVEGAVQSGSYAAASKVGGTFGMDLNSVFTIAADAMVDKVILHQSVNVGQVAAQMLGSIAANHAAAAINDGLFGSPSSSKQAHTKKKAEPAQRDYEQFKHDYQEAVYYSTHGYTTHAAMAAQGKQTMGGGSDLMPGDGWAAAANDTLFGEHATFNSAFSGTDSAGWESEARGVLDEFGMGPGSMFGPRTHRVGGVAVPNAMRANAAAEREAEHFMTSLQAETVAVSRGVRQRVAARSSSQDVALRAKYGSFAVGVGHFLLAHRNSAVGRAVLSGAMDLTHAINYFYQHVGGYLNAAGRLAASADFAFDGSELISGRNPYTDQRVSRLTALENGIFAVGGPMDAVLEGAAVRLARWSAVRFFGREVVGSRVGAESLPEIKALASPRDFYLSKVEHPKLYRIVDRLYRPNAKFGTGSTADAVRHELSSGELLSRTSHIRKAIESRNALSTLIHSNNLSASDQQIALWLREDLQNALTEQPWNKVYAGRQGMTP